MKNEEGVISVKGVRVIHLKAVDPNQNIPRYKLFHYLVISGVGLFELYRRPRDRLVVVLSLFGV